MGRFKARTSSSQAVGESGTWVGALSQVLDKLGISTKTTPELPELGPDIQVEVTDSVTGVQIAISTVGFPEEPDLLPRDDESTEVIEPPSLKRSAVYAQRETEGLSALERVVIESGNIAATDSVEAAYELGLDILLAAVPAESASVLIGRGDTLRFVAARGPRSAAVVGTEMPIDQGIAGLVMSKKKGLMVREASRSEAHYQSVDRAVEYHTRTVLAVPMIAGGEVLGVLELLNPFGSGEFAEWHQRAAVRVGRRIAKRIAAG
jgi:hypothetical protein